MGAFLACSSFSDNDEAGVGAVDGGDAPSAVDGPAIDAPLTTDAPAGDSTMPAPPFCKTYGGTFCEDFDDPGSAGFPSTSLWDGGTVGVVTDPFFSPPKSLRTTFVKPPDGACRYANVYNTSLASPIVGGYRVEYRIFAKTIPGRILHGPALGTRDTNTTDACSVYMETTASGASLIVEPQGIPDPSQYIQLSRKIVPGQWSHVVVDITGSAGGRKASVVIDGVAAVSGVQLIAQCQSLDRLTDIAVGLICVTADVGGDIDVAFDDVRVNTY
jgi:hypothetical protein